MAKVLGDHYPEFAGKTIFANFPSFVAGMINTFSIFVPAKTKAKMEFVGPANVQNACLQYVTPSHLLESLGGLLNPGIQFF